MQYSYPLVIKLHDHWSRIPYRFECFCDLIKTLKDFILYNISCCLIALLMNIGGQFYQGIEHQYIGNQEVNTKVLCRIYLIFYVLLYLTLYMPSPTKEIWPKSYGK